MTLAVHIRKTIGAFALHAEFESAGRVTALFGQSGAGKTTLINLIAGLVAPDSGSIAVDGAVLFDRDRRIDVPAHRRRVGYVFQEGRLFPHLSVRSNLLYGRRLGPHRGHSAPVEPIIALLGIGGLLDRRPATLSGGEKQRVAIGRALLADPRILLMDEPLASLDQARKEEILPYIERLRDEMALPIVYVSHTVEEVVRLADTVVLMAAGRVVASGTTRDVFARLDLGTAIDRPSHGAVIEARIAAHDHQTGMTRLAHPAGELFHPLLREPVGTTIRLRVRARDVAIAAGEPGRLSIRNRLAATVAEIAPGPPPIVEVRLDIAGEPLIASITGDAVAELNLKVGQSVTALIKAAAFDRPAPDHETGWPN